VREAARAGTLPDGFPVGRGPVVALASRMDGHKGAQHLLAAMKTVWERHPDAQLVYVGRDARFGRGMMSDYLRERAGERLGSVHILGGQPADRYFAAVAASDVIAIPSLWESFCLAAVEAMALGRPVIGTSGHGFSEYLRPGENGLLVERGEVEPLAEAIAALLDDEALRQRMGEAAARTADELDVDVVAARYVDVLARVSSAA
jgi:glycosyltransferase involved in cell wall biosynthesis